jgi:hypothetical protein
VAAKVARKHGIGSGEKREARRFPVGWPVKITGVDATGLRFEEASVAKDLSSKGVFVSLTRAVAVGSELQVLIKVPLGQQQWMSYPGRVVRADSQRSQHRVGIRFSTVKPAFVKG